MPHLDPDQARHLLRGGGVAEAELDLRGLPQAEALARLKRLVDQPVRPGPVRYAVRIDPPVPGGGETLFHPVGRFLLDARRRERVVQFAPLADPPGGGFFVELGTG
ncbi:MAG: hypothetical protein JNL71_07840 [Rhodospirillales bacterium]|nr:hypothetical protein [Rhodospirillales bacterium]